MIKRLCWGKHTDWNCSPWPGTIVTIYVSYFMIGGPGKEHWTNKPSLTLRVQERSKGDTTCPTTSQNPSRWHPSWLSKACATRKDSESEWLVKDNLKTNRINIKPETVSHEAEPFSWIPLPFCSPPGCPFPIKSLDLSAPVSPQAIHFRVLDKRPPFSPWKGSPFLQQLGLCASIAGGMDLILGWGTKILKAIWYSKLKKKLSPGRR